MQTTKCHGFTFFITIGKYGGFYCKAYKTGTIRLCLGLIAFTVCFYDAERAVSQVIEGNKKQINNDHHPTT